MEFSDSLMRDARSLQCWYLRGLLIDGWNAAIGGFRKVGNVGGRYRMNCNSASLFNRMSGVHGLSRFPLKQLIEWGEHLTVGQPQIDAQHEAIFDLALEIADFRHQPNRTGQLKILAERLYRVLEGHFRYEEDQLAAIGYKKLSEHHAEHKMMLEELDVIRGRIDEFERGLSYMNPESLLRSYVLGVTVGHLVHSDMECSAFLRDAVSANKQA